MTHGCLQRRIMFWEWVIPSEIFEIAIVFNFVFLIAIRRTSPDSLFFFSLQGFSLSLLVTYLVLLSPGIWPSKPQPLRTSTWSSVLDTDPTCVFNILMITIWSHLSLSCYFKLLCEVRSASTRQRDVLPNQINWQHLSSFHQRTNDTDKSIESSQNAT